MFASAESLATSVLTIAEVILESSQLLVIQPT